MMGPLLNLQLVQDLVLTPSDVIYKHVEASAHIFNCRPQASPLCTAVDKRCVLDTAYATAPTP